MPGLADITNAARAVGRAAARAKAKSDSAPAPKRTSEVTRGTPVISGGRRRAAIDAVVDEVQEGSIIRR